MIANDKYPAAIHTSNRVYTTPTQHAYSIGLYRIRRIIYGVLFWRFDKPPNLNSPFILIVVVIQIRAAYGIVESKFLTVKKICRKMQK